MITKDLVVGRRYRLIGSTSWAGNVDNMSSQGFEIGKSYECTSLNGLTPGARGRTNTIYIMSPTQHHGIAVYLQDLAEGWASRKEHAEEVGEEVKELKKKLKQKESEYERLIKYDSDEEEIASLLVTAMDEGGDKAERIKNLSKLLKGRLRTDIL